MRKLGELVWNLACVSHLTWFNLLVHCLTAVVFSTALMHAHRIYLSPPNCVQNSYEDHFRFLLQGLTWRQATSASLRSLLEIQNLSLGPHPES